MFSLCLDYVHVQYMTSICLQYQTFVLAKSNICPSDPTFVLSLSPRTTKIDGKSSRQNLVKLWTWLSTPLPSGHPASGQNLDDLWTWRNLKFVHPLSMSIFRLKYECISVLYAGTNLWWISDTCLTYVHPLSTPKIGPWPAQSKLTKIVLLRYFCTTSCNQLWSSCLPHPNSLS